MNNKLKAITATALIATTTLTGCASLERELKSATSDLTGGLDRHVTAYSHDCGKAF